MSPHRTIVLVLGAGASAPYGFPLGRRLLELAATQDPFHFTRAEKSRFQSDVGRVQRLTIDACVADLDKSDSKAERIARVVVPLLIADAERPEQLRDLTATGAWIRSMLHDLVDIDAYGTLRAPSNSSVHVGTFNYVRSFEWTLVDAMEARSSRAYDANAYKQVIGRVHHVYGHAGGLGERDETRRTFGERPTIEQIEAAAQTIGFIGTPGGSGLPDETARALRNAEHVGFLGTGYHAENLARLELRTWCVDRQEQFPRLGVLWIPAHAMPLRASFHGTVFGLSEADRRDRIAQRFDCGELGPIALGSEHEDCSGFLNRIRGLFVTQEDFSSPSDDTSYGADD